MLLGSRPRMGHQQESGHLEVCCWGLCGVESLCAMLLLSIHLRSNDLVCVCRGRGVHKSFWQRLMLQLHR